MNPTQCPKSRFEAQLEALDEGLEVPEYFDENFDAQEAVEEAREHYADSPRLLTGLEELSDIEVLEAFEPDSLFRLGSGGEIELWLTDNPRGIWSGWCVGGRFADSLPLQTAAGGGEASQAALSVVDVAALAARGVETHGVEFGQFTGVVAGGEWMRAPEPATIRALLERAGGDALLTVADCYV